MKQTKEEKEAAALKNTSRWLKKASADFMPKDVLAVLRRVFAAHQRAVKQQGKQ